MHQSLSKKRRAELRHNVESYARFLNPLGEMSFGCIRQAHLKFFMSLTHSKNYSYLWGWKQILTSWTLMLKETKSSKYGLTKYGLEYSLYPDMPNLDAPRLPYQSTTLPTSRIPQAKSGARIVPSVVAVPQSCRSQSMTKTPEKHSKSVRRNSVRLSTMRRRTGRLSIFKAFSVLDNEADRVSFSFAVFLVLVSEF